MTATQIRRESLERMNVTANNDRLRNALKVIPAREYQDIREAYYKAAEGLRALAEALEVADSAVPFDGQSGSPLINEHLIACGALKALEKSDLGRVV